MDSQWSPYANALLNLLLVYLSNQPTNETLQRDIETLKNIIETYKDNPSIPNEENAKMNDICIRYSISEPLMKCARILLLIQQMLVACNEHNREITSDEKNLAKKLHDAIRVIINKKHDALREMLETNKTDMNTIYSLYNDVLYNSKCEKSIFELSDNEPAIFESEYSKAQQRYLAEHTVNTQAISANQFTFGGRYKKVSRHSRSHKRRRRSKRKFSNKRNKHYNKL
jgi:hypothetical protein